MIASLEAYELDNRRRNDASLVVLDSILNELSRRGTPCLLFKGPVLGQQAYPDPGMLPIFPPLTLRAAKR